MLRREGSMVRPNTHPVELGTCSGLASVELLASNNFRHLCQDTKRKAFIIFILNDRFLFIFFF